MAHVLSRIAIVNRGEPALRLLRAARDLAAQRHIDIHCIALYTEADAHSLYLRRADSSYCLGPAKSYLDYGVLKDALRATGATAAWVGWGFVAEHAEFAELCATLGITFIGPPASAMRALGDKISSKRLAEAAAVPVSAWTGGAVADVAAAKHFAESHGLPLMVKATAGGGGRGVRRVDQMAELEAAFISATSEAEKAFGNGDCYLERLIESARHVEVQIAADAHGHAWAVGLRDCTLQRKHQKVIEEAPPASVPMAIQGEMAEAARRLALKAGYRSLGTVEYLYAPADQRFYFMEMNARLQVEHPVTEQTTGLDLVALQLGIALGDALHGEPPPTRGHAIEVRLNTEDAARAFAPAPGRLALIEWPLGPGIRVDAGYAEGEVVPDSFDSMIAKIIATGSDREQARTRLIRALDETKVMVEGGTTNKSFLRALLADPEVQKDAIDVRWIDAKPPGHFFGELQAPELALCFAAVEAWSERRRQQLERFAVSARRGRLELGESDVAELGFSLQGQAHAVRVAATEPGRYEVQIADAVFAVSVERHSDQHRIATVGDKAVPYVVFRDASAWIIEVLGETLRLGSASANQVQAPGPGLVQSVAVEAGDAIAVGDVICVLEAMKTETAVRAARPGRVKRVLVSAGMQVKASATLVEVEAEGASSDEPRASFARSLYASPSRLRLQDWLRGYDSTHAHALPLLQNELATKTAADRFAALLPVLEIAHRVLAFYTPQVGVTDGSDREISAEAALLSYVARGCSLETAKLAPVFAERLATVLAQYPNAMSAQDGIARLERAFDRLKRSSAVLARLLERDRPPREAQTPEVRERFRKALEGIIALGSDTVLDLVDAAHRVWFVDIERPLLDVARARQEGRIRERLRLMLEQAPEHWPAAELQRIAETPEPLLALSAKVAQKPDGTRLVAELFLRRFYGAVAQLAPIVHEAGVATTRFDDERVLVIVCSESDAIAGFAKHAEPGLLVDMIVLSANAEVFAKLEAGLAKCSAKCKRLCISAADPERGHLWGYRSYTFAGEAPQEIEAYRNVHPKITERFELPRLSRFTTHRLDAPEDIYVVSAVSKEHPQDTRLYAFLHFRGVSEHGEGGASELRDRLETLLREAALVMRRAIQKNPRKPPMWNRVIVYCAQPYVYPIEMLAELLNTLAPLFRPLHLERISFRVRLPDGELSFLDRSLTFGFDGHRFVSARASEPSREPLRPLSPYVQKVLQLRRRGLTYAYEVVSQLAPSEADALSPAPCGSFQELELEGDSLVPTSRAPGENRCAVVVGIVSNITDKHPEGMRRVLLVGDASIDMGSLAEAECRRVIAAIDLADAEKLPLEWFPLSSGAAISMTSGTENLDWTARVLRRIIEHTQKGGEINIVVDGINVGAQSYWNAEATMLMHTRGALIMTQKGAMVLTGKRALEFSGGVSAPDHQGIGGVERIMGPNGEAQYSAASLPDAIRILFRYYERSYVAPGESRPRHKRTTDVPTRDMAAAPYTAGSEWKLVGEIFADATNPGRKRSFDIRAVMRALIDNDDEPLERFAAMRDAESAVVWDAHVGGIAASIIGIESRAIDRRGFVPADGPERFSGGTLFPLSSKKVARALNAASGRRPVVVLANLSGFDGSPESLRRLQLEYGAEIGRAIVNFNGPIVFSVLCRYHGGAYVVFSKTLNEGLHASALEGAFASVIGGAPAAAVVFTQEVRRRVATDPRLYTGENEQQLEREHTQLLAEEFDRTHDIHRAKRMGSIDEVLKVKELRAQVIQQIGLKH